MFRSSSFLKFNASVYGKRSITATSDGAAARNKKVTKLDWQTVIAIQVCSVISIMSSTFIFSTGIFMVKDFLFGSTYENSTASVVGDGDVDVNERNEAKAALRCGLLIASKPFFSAISSYAWGTSGDVYGFKANILVSLTFVAAINLLFGFCDTYAKAVFVRSLSGFFDGIVVLVKPALSMISDKTNANRAFGTTGLAYGLGTSVAPAVAAFLANPCTSWKMYSTYDDGNNNNGNNNKCPEILAKYPFVLSSSWITILAIPAFVFAFFCMRIVPPVRPLEENSNNNSMKDVELAERGVVVAVEEIEEEEEEEEEDAGEDQKLVSVPLADSDCDDLIDDKEIETRKLIVGAQQKMNSDSIDDSSKAINNALSSSPSSSSSTMTKKKKKSIWVLLKDEDIKHAITLQIIVTMNVLTGTEITPIWLATSIANGGLGWKTQDIGIFGTVMGITIMSFQLFAFVKLTDRFGIVRLVTWALFLSAFIYPCHSIANTIARYSKAGAWVMVLFLGIVRGSLGPIMMGGVSLIVNNASPRDSLGVVNGFAGTFSNLSRALAPLIGGSLIAMMAASDKDLPGRNYIPFVPMGIFFLFLGWYSMRLSRRLDVPRTH